MHPKKKSTVANKVDLEALKQVTANFLKKHAAGDETNDKVDIGCTQADSGKSSVKKIETKSVRQSKKAGKAEKNDEK